MIEDDICLLAAGDKSLARLEDDIWRGVDAFERARRTSRTVMSYQAGIVVVVLFAAAAAGAASASVVTERPVVVAAGSEIAPSALLLGVRP